MKRILKEATAEIGGNTVYVSQYNPNKSQQDWIPLQSALRVSPAAKKTIKDVVGQLSAPEINQLRSFQPKPTPDITITGGDEAIVTFPNGRKKTVDI